VTAEPQAEIFSGIGKPELFYENLSGMWSRRIDETWMKPIGLFTAKKMGRLL